MHRVAGLAALLALAAGGAAAEVIAAACPGPGAADLLLLPEERSAALAPPAGGVAVTGAYTGAEPRAEARPKPVGVFLRDGATVSLELARMDGMLVVDAEGAATLATTRAVPLGGTTFDLSDLAGRMAFAEAAEAAGASALQSHLLIRDGALDLRAVEGAPTARRRALMETPDGRLLLWESDGPLTLHAAAEAMRAAHAPAMALNLDMGSFDFCRRGTAEGWRNCGFVTADTLDRLSNVLVLADDPDCR
ncbi:MAG: hypothetical protein R6V44_07445 [Paracoccaceae bacterium]